MPYEYKIVRSPINTIADDEFEAWLNKLGAKNWRLIRIGLADIHKFNLNKVSIFERKIEINQKLRDMQIKANPEKEILNGEKGSVE